MIDYKLVAYLSLLYVPSVFSEESIDQLLQRLKISEALHYKYVETKEMEMLSLPWKSQGEIYLTTEKFYVHQLAPDNTLLSVSESELKYTDLDSGQTRIKPLSAPYEIPGFGPLLRINFGITTSDSLNKDYKLKQKYTNNQWGLRLTPRLFRGAGISSIDLRGPINQHPNFLKVEYFDGDTTTWEFKPLAVSEPAMNSLEALLTELDLD